jgi:3-methyladenine DNA glycosylase AlkD
MTVEEIMTELRSKGSESIKKILLKHGVKEPFFGVKVEYLKTIQKKIKKDYSLSKELYATGNADAMYLAGLIADDKKMTRTDLQSWVQQAVSLNISEYTVPWVTAESMYGYELALLWIDSPKENIAAAGWATLSGVVALKEDTELNLASLKALLTRVVKNISNVEPRVMQTMNGFVIAVGVFVTPLTEDALAAAKKIQAIASIMEGAAARLQDATAYIMKIKAKGGLGKKKKTVKC